MIARDGIWYDLILQNSAMYFSVTIDCLSHHIRKSIMLLRHTKESLIDITRWYHYWYSYGQKYHQYKILQNSAM